MALYVICDGGWSIWLRSMLILWRASGLVRTSREEVEGTLVSGS